MQAPHVVQIGPLRPRRPCLPDLPQPADQWRHAGCGGQLLHALPAADGRCQISALPHDEGTAPWPGPGAGQELVSEALRVPVHAQPRPGVPAPQPPSSWPEARGLRLPLPFLPLPNTHWCAGLRLHAQAAHQTCRAQVAPGLLPLGATSFPETGEKRVSQPPRISDRFLNVVTPRPTGSWGWVGCSSVEGFQPVCQVVLLSPLVSQSQTCTHSRPWVSRTMWG